MVRARRAPWRAAPWPRSGAAWAFSGRGTAYAALSLGPRPDVPAGAVSPAVSRDRVRRRHRPRARARRQAGRVADQHPDLPRLGDPTPAVRRHGHRDRRAPRPGRAGDGGAPPRSRDRAAGEPARERRSGDRVHAARAEAAARRGDDRAAASPGRAHGVHRRVTRRLVVDLVSPRAAWRIPPATVQTIRAALGSGWEVVQVQAPAASDGDGGSGSPEAVAAARSAEIYVGYGVPPGVIAAGRGTLRWVHTATAGVWMSLPSVAGTGIVLTNSAAVHAEPIADWTIAALGYFARGLDRMRAFQAAEHWASPELTAVPVSVREFAELRLGVFGLGGIGGAIARRGLALGMSV